MIAEKSSVALGETPRVNMGTDYGAFAMRAGLYLGDLADVTDSLTKVQGQFYQMLQELGLGIGPDGQVVEILQGTNTLSREQHLMLLGLLPNSAHEGVAVPLTVEPRGGLEAAMAKKALAPEELVPTY